MNGRFQSFLAIMAFVMAVATSVCSAHEIGVLNVELRVQDGGRITTIITTDPEHLAQTPALGINIPANANRATLEHAIGPLADRLRAGCELVVEGTPYSLGMAVDGRAVMPGDLGVGSPSSPRLVVVFSGTVPHSAASIEWRTRLDVGQYMLRALRTDDSVALSQWLKPGQLSGPIVLRASTPTSAEPQPTATTPKTEPIRSIGSVALEYLRLGYTHILPDGLDHILFVLGLFLASAKIRPLLVQVTAFTVAHSISLGLAAAGLVHLSPSIVEPAIAASIVFVAVENLATSRVAWRRTAIVFGFGLIHGLGFAGVLGEIGLPKGQFLPALASFNVGVEAGQLTVIALAFAAVGLWRQRASYRQWVTVPASLGIAAIGLFWTIQRLAGHGM